MGGARFEHPTQRLESADAPAPEALMDEDKKDDPAYLSAGKGNLAKINRLQQCGTGPPPRGTILRRGAGE